MTNSTLLIPTVRTQSPQVGAGVIIIKDSLTLLTQRQNNHGEGSFGSLGGHIEFGESPLEAVKREALEELGIEIRNIKFLCCMSMIKYNKHYIDLSFSAEIAAGEPKIIDTDKIASVDWYPLNNLPSPLFEPVRVALEAYNGGPAFYDVREQ